VWTGAGGSRRKPNLPLVAVFGLLVVLAAVAPGGGRILDRAVLAACLVVLAVVQWTVDWRPLVVALVVWLAILGVLRRLLTELTDRTGTDGLLLVAPAVLGLLMLSAMREGAFERRSRLTTAVLALGALSLAGVANVSQVPLIAGVVGLMFVLVPQTAFWTGRVLSDAALRTALRVFAALALLAAIYGMLQTFTGLLPWDRRWVAEAGYMALNVGGVIRPFGISSSSAEYAVVLSVGAVCWLALPLWSRWVRLPAAALLLTALVLASSRSFVVMLVIALALMGAARLRVGGATAVALAALAIGLIPALAAVAVPSTQGTSAATSALLEHQAEGLADPLDPEKSTAVGHALIAGEGLLVALQHPFGLGTGAINMGTKFGGEQVQTEVDVSNVAVAFGPIGLLVFVVVVGIGMVRAYRTASGARNPLALAALGILVATSNHWLNGGMYAVAWLPWLVLGWLDRPASEYGQEGSGR
jgi:hypothetical protein